MVLGVVVLLLLSMGLTSLLSILTQSDVSLPSGALDFTLRLFSFLIMLAVFLTIYRYVPNTRVLWRHVWLGALAAAIAFEIAKTLFATYLTAWASYQQIYGQVASLIVILVWVYISALIIIIGSELSAQYSRMRYKLDIGETA
jgi:membrane protein